MLKILAASLAICTVVSAAEFVSPVVVGNLTDSATAAIALRQSLIVSDGVWASLSSAQRNLVSARYAVEVTEKGRYARIVYVQPINESTAGTTAGAHLGSALGQAQYIDKSNWNNYSAKGQLGAALLGGLIGSTLDAKPQSIHRLVYTLKASDGSVRVVERVSQSQIYVAPGLCIETVEFAPVKDEFCENTWPSEIKAVLGPSLSEGQGTAIAPGTRVISVPPSSPIQMSPIVPISKDDQVYCRLGPTSTAQTSAMKCLQAGGTIQP